MGQQAFFPQIGEALSGEDGVSHPWVDAGAEIFGQSQTCGIFEIAPEKRPGPADGGLAFMQPCPSLKKMQRPSAPVRILSLPPECSP